MSDQRIVIVGGGFAGVHAAIGAVEIRRSARERRISIELVSPEPYLEIRPRLYEADLAGVKVPLAGVLGPLGVRHRAASVVEIDAARRRLGFDDGDGGVRYDQLVLAPGSRSTPPPGRATHSVNSHAEASALQDAVARLAARRAPTLGVVVVGAGFTGIEVSCELAAILAPAGEAAGRPGAGGVTLVGRESTVAPGFGPRPRAVIEEALSGLGVALRTGVAVAEVRADRLVLADGSEARADLVVWCTGPRASSLTEQVAAERDGLGRLRVDGSLSTAVEGIWAAGDCAAAPVDDNGRTALMSCQHAMPQGRLAGSNAARALLGRPPRRYRQSLYLNCLDLGGHGALLTAGYDHAKILATGEQGKRFKRHINRSLIYPPAGADVEALLATGRPTSIGPVAAVVATRAMASRRFRDRVICGGGDRAAAYGARPGDHPVSAPSRKER